MVGVYTDDNKLVIIIASKTIRFDLFKKVDNTVKHKINIIINHNEFLAEDNIKNEIIKLLSKYKHENDIHEHEKQ